jgi:hypothetical protein
MMVMRLSRILFGNQSGLEKPRHSLSGVPIDDRAGMIEGEGVGRV